MLGDDYLYRARSLRFTLQMLAFMALNGFEIAAMAEGSSRKSWTNSMR